MQTPVISDVMERKNTHSFREPWLHEAVAELYPVFAKAGLAIPEKLRCAFSLTSAGTKGARKGECWPATASGDSHFEIFISPDVAEPVEVLGILVHSLVHACLPGDAGHGVAYRRAATRVGLEGQMRHALPGADLTKTLEQIANKIGPLPHAALDFHARILDRPLPADRPKKQGTRMLRAECPGVDGVPCGYAVRVTAMWVRKLGPPRCPVHGSLTVVMASPSDDDEHDADGRMENV